MKNYDKCWMKPMVACLMMLQAALLHSVEGDVKIGDANRLEVATSVAKLVFDTSNAPDLRQWTDERFAPTTREWVVKLAGIMASDGWTPPKEIHFQFVADQLQSCKNAASLASAEGNTVSLNADWFRKNLDGEALGATIHVLVRFMQGYCSEGQKKDNCPSWAVEGYADYIRWMLFEPEANGCGFVRKDPDKYRYNDSYRVTAHFFDFVENSYPGTMKKLNAALRNHTFDNGKFWQDATGKSVEELEADWKTALAPYGKFTDGMLSKTRPAGWLAEACRIQADGLTGHPEALSYPYDTCLWAGTIPRMGTHGKDWWRYEQTAYYVDGLLRLGYATGDEAFIKKGEENIDYTLEHAAPDGHLGHPSLWDATRYKLKNGYDMWPLAVFFRAMKAKYDAAPDARIPAALQKNFLNYDKERVSKARNIINVEGLLWTYAHAGDKRLLDLAEAAWNLREPLPPEKKNELAPKNCANNDAIHMHGVSYCEEMKVPMILYAYTGKKEYLNQAVNVERKLVRDHMLPDGCPTSAERTLGNSVHVCHETCDAVDYTWSLGYFLEATGDAAYADRIERCVFNAGFGAIGDDFKSLQYFSNVNQFIATSNSDHNPQNYGTTWMQYRPTHETECCAGNVNRILPNYISRMWLKDKDGAPVAALYGPSEVDFGWAKIKEETNYPFDGKVVFRFSMAEPKETAFTYRVPGWCKGASVKVNGEAVAPAMPGSFASIARRFADGDVIELDLPMDVCFEEIPRRFVVDGKDAAKRLVKRPAAKFANSSQGTVVVRGPLVFAYPIPAECTEDVEEHDNMNGKRSGNPGFKCWNLRPAGPFNYALASHKAEVVSDGVAGDGFFKKPGAVKLRVSVRRIKWELDENRFTPDLPERPELIGDEVETIEFVPYGATMLRLGVFPDVSQETFFR